jgi:transcriptional regulator with XRE-family HTH domain
VVGGDSTPPRGKVGQALKEVRGVKRGRNAVLKLLRVWAGKYQQDVARYLHTDQSTVSRIESGELLITPDLEWRYVLACGGLGVLQTLIDHLQSLLERLNNHNRLLPA